MEEDNARKLSFPILTTRVTFTRCQRREQLQKKEDESDANGKRDSVSVLSSEKRPSFRESLPTLASSASTAVGLLVDDGPLSGCCPEGPFWPPPPLWWAGERETFRLGGFFGGGGSSDFPAAVTCCSEKRLLEDVREEVGGSRGERERNSDEGKLPVCPSSPSAMLDALGDCARKSFPPVRPGGIAERLARNANVVAEGVDRLERNVISQDCSAAEGTPKTNLSFSATICGHGGRGEDGWRRVENGDIFRRVSQV